MIFALADRGVLVHVIVRSDAAFFVVSDVELFVVLSVFLLFVMVLLCVARKLSFAVEPVFRPVVTYRFHVRRFHTRFVAGKTANYHCVGGKNGQQLIECLMIGTAGGVEISYGGCIAGKCKQQEENDVRHRSV
jgi:hypothetical protein